ncbi:hypothetical protein B0H19DRAFT_1071249 [Mycena capillaripes]|nr:hypothetical protein B0H19DRAFT_1071249 [Mycena capillaripes]
MTMSEFLKIRVGDILHVVSGAPFVLFPPSRNEIRKSRVPYCEVTSGFRSSSLMRRRPSMSESATTEQAHAHVANATRGAWSSALVLCWRLTTRDQGVYFRERDAPVCCDSHMESAVVVTSLVMPQLGRAEGGWTEGPAWPGSPGLGPGNLKPKPKPATRASSPGLKA